MALDLISRLPILTDEGDVERAWSDILPLARQEGLTVYDAAYLDLAMRLALPLLTLDRDLAAAAKRLGVPVLP